MKDNTKMRRIIWFEEWQMEIVESWLADWARKGWRLEKMGVLFAVFRKCEPSALRYRCDANPVSNKLGDADRKAIYASAGWRYIASRQNVMIFCTEDPAAVEIHTDPYEYAGIYNNVASNNKTNVIVNSIILVIWIVNLVIQGKASLISNCLLNGVDFSYFWLILLFGCILCQNIAGLIAVSLVYRRLSAGRPIMHERPYKISHHLSIVLKPLISICMVVFLAACIINLVGGISYLLPAPIPAGRLAVVRATDISQEYVKAPNMVLGSDFITFNADNYYKITGSILVPEQIYLSESGNPAGAALPDYGESQLQLESEKYRALSPWLADVLAENLSMDSRAIDRPDGGWGGPLPPSADKMGLDNLWRYDNPDSIRHEIVAQKGCMVYRIYYHGPATTDDLLKLLENRIAQEK